MFDGDMSMLSSSLGHHSFTSSAVPPEASQNDADLFKYHNIPVSRRPFVNRIFLPLPEPDLTSDRSCSRQLLRIHGTSENGAVLCSHYSLGAPSKCVGRTALICDLRSKLLMYTQSAERRKQQPHSLRARTLSQRPRSGAH